MIRSVLVSVAVVAGLLYGGILQAQQFAAKARIPAGDSPELALPLARDVSANLTTAEVDKAIRKVADWQIERVKNGLSTEWTYGVLQAGLVAASDTLINPVYANAVRSAAQERGWRLGPRMVHADDQVVAQAYLGVYRHDGKAEQLAPLKRQFDQLKVMPDDPKEAVWWWCDALFMAPPVWSGLYRVTEDRSYLDYMDRQWWITTRNLYDPQERLFTRDATFLDRKEKNGRKLFWLRGNGWVMGGVARVLQNLPADYPSRGKYEQQFKDMAARMASLQGEDGLWRAGLLDQQAYPLPETSGSALVTYAMAWGVNNGVLSRAEYLPVIQKAWRGLVSHIYEDGRLGCIQPVGDRPDSFRPTSSYVYGVGAFLLAGSELHKLAESPAGITGKGR